MFKNYDFQKQLIIEFCKNVYVLLVLNFSHYMQSAQVIIAKD
jgi:hypothetical protein